MCYSIHCLFTCEPGTCQSSIYFVHRYFWNARTWASAQTPRRKGCFIIIIIFLLFLSSLFPYLCQIEKRPWQSSVRFLHVHGLVRGGSHRLPYAQVCTRAHLFWKIYRGRKSKKGGERGGGNREEWGGGGELPYLRARTGKWVFCKCNRSQRRKCNVLQTLSLAWGAFTVNRETCEAAQSAVKWTPRT